ncbi:tyrosine-protein phosphatase, partial [Bacillus cereus]
INGELALGVPEDTVMKDYMLSNEYRKALNEKTIGALQAQVKDPNSLEILKSMFEVREEYLGAALQEIKEKYGSIDQYLEKELGVTKEKRKQMQDMLLEK